MTSDYQRSRDTSVQLSQRGSVPLRFTALYNGNVVAQRAKTVAEWAERMRSAKTPTEDDVTILLDGRRLDSRELVEAWLEEVEALRELEAASGDIAL